MLPASGQLLHLPRTFYLKDGGRQSRDRNGLRILWWCSLSGLALALAPPGWQVEQLRQALTPELDIVSKPKQDRAVATFPRRELFTPAPETGEHVTPAEPT